MGWIWQRLMIQRWWEWGKPAENLVYQEVMMSFDAVDTEDSESVLLQDKDRVCKGV